jgi:hypothetical protein
MILEKPKRRIFEIFSGKGSLHDRQLQVSLYIIKFSGKHFEELSGYAANLFVGEGGDSAAAFNSSAEEEILDFFDRFSVVAW